MEFRDKYLFLSNFSPSIATVKGLRYPSVENAFQACKVLNLEERRKFTSITSSQARSLGRKVSLRSDWNEIRIELMRCLIVQKFKDPSLRKQLLATGTIELVEDNKWGDKFWGRCNGKGKNMLGKILMDVREKIRKGEC